ncbi:MAG: hypothetical protein J0M07_01885 [Anaerolineae bacterium]|uniref:hypothetical protein n=1 Tax=Candidatus Flexifilum breve TaxID=3140694 RepID=UPI001AC6C757|nr:hypothetical protein [Chloroflexota bacterium]MBN8634046.1 hypothetical protein [Anaerolineae bacterium]
MRRLFAALSTAVAMGFGLFMLWGLVAGSGFVNSYANNILKLVLPTVAIGVLIGLLNLLGVHFGRIRRRERQWGYSLIVIVAAAAVIILWLLNVDDVNRLLLEDVQVAIESALAGLVLFALVYGAYRIMSRRVSWGNFLFILSLLVILIGALPLRETAFIADVRAWLLAVPVSAGARGILLGIALATVVTGVRVLIGQDRAYRE